MRRLKGCGRRDRVATGGELTGSSICTSTYDNQSVDDKIHKLGSGLEEYWTGLKALETWEDEDITQPLQQGQVADGKLQNRVDFDTYSSIQMFSTPCPCSSIQGQPKKQNVPFVSRGECPLPSSLTAYPTCFQKQGDQVRL